MDFVHSDPPWSLVVKSVVGISSTHDHGLSVPKEVVLVCRLDILKGRGGDKSGSLFPSASILGPRLSQKLREAGAIPHVQGREPRASCVNGHLAFILSCSRIDHGPQHLQ